MEVPQNKKIDGDIVLRWLSRSVNQKGKGVLFVLYASSWTCKSKRWWSGIWIVYAMCDESPLAELRAEDRGRSIRAGCYARGWRGRKGGGGGGGGGTLSLALSPPSNPSYSAPLQCDHVSSHNMPHAPSSNLRVNARTGLIMLWVISRHRCHLANFNFK